MGVNTFLLDRRTATLVIGGRKQTIGTLRRFFKVTELDPKRAGELDAAARITPSPVAAVVMDITELPLASAPDTPVSAHLVLGWDDGRGSVTDFGWDHLPQLGYAVRDSVSGAYVLHEEQGGLLQSISLEQAHGLGLVDTDGRLIRRGQPRVTDCRSVRHYITGYAEADCVLNNDRDERLLIAICGDSLPPETWLVGKRPMDIERYP
jgi:hypothetical protein